MVINRETKSKVKIGYVGLGRRGISMLKNCFSEMPDVEITWICDLKPEKIERTLKMLQEKGRPTPKTTADYHEIMNDPDVDAVVIMTGWDSHVACSLTSMRAGKYTAVEVGTAYELSECYALVDTYEQTGAPLMMLENCCYGRREMMALRMVKEGLFGEIVHCDGGYLHYLNEMDLFVSKDGGCDSEHYRVYDYQNRNCEQYPTHELGPISKVLGINRGNRMMTLSSFSSKSRGLQRYIKEHVASDHPLHNATFRQGDIITTVITCAGGETVHLTLDTTVPRPYYSRSFTVRGTKGCCMEAGGNNCTFYLEGMKEGVFNNEAEFYAEHDHPLHAEYSKIEMLGGHGGMDWLVVRAFIESVKAGTDTPIDAYDTAAWMAIGPLSEMSIAKGGAPVDVPDFTRGKWFRREPAVKGKYCLDEICEDPNTPIVPTC
ncbi:MAG: Gfo/Idh/MocA family oxidoreductase [Clostridia bacterium]|nr:Gfo/Idh/MocA family oxidoreductase [Clostridia bacterium]